MTSDPRTTPATSRNNGFAAAATCIVGLCVLFSTAGVLEARHWTSLSSLNDGDIWWHLRTGLWMLEHHALPHTGLFSQSADSPWIAASWLYDLKLAIWYKLVGLAAIPVFAMFLKAGLGAVMFLLAGGRRGNFWATVVASAVAQYIVAAVPPTAQYCSIIFFGVELLLLVESRRDENLRLLYWLPPVFLVWANVDPHFVYGLVLLGLFLAASAMGPTLRQRSFGGKLPGIAVVCVGVTFITPYLYRPYGVFFSTAFSAANSYLPDYHALGFRQPHDYVFLLYAMAAFLGLGLRRSRDQFLIALLAASAVLSFHSQHDLWLVVLAACAALGEAMRSGDQTDVGAVSGGIGEGDALASEEKGLYGRDVLVASALTIVVLAIAAVLFVPHNREALLAKAGENYPVAAADYIREHQLPPLFNAYEWGGFLTWYLPDDPIAIDGRTDLYGDDAVVAYFKVMNVETRFTDFPPLANAGTIILPRDGIMAQTLSSLPAYKVAYSDNVATVLTRTAGDEPR